MNHSITVQRFGIRLRPVTPEDAEFIFALRRNPLLNAYIGEFNDQFSVHANWLKRYFEREGDYYFIVETARSRIPAGTIAIYNRDGDTAEWGRFVIVPPYPAAPASVWLMYHVAFDVLGLAKMYCRTVIDNKHVVSFHDHCGALRTAVEPKAITIKGVAMDWIVHTVTSDRWPLVSKRLEPAAVTAERFIEEVT